MFKPLVSICVSIHNTAQYLPRCLDSLVNQTYTNIEIILVNNGSTDNSEEIMHHYLNTYHDKIIKIFNQIDLGLAQGRQRGVIESSGEYIAFLDADDYFLPSAIEMLVDRVVECNADIGEIQTTRGKEIIKSKYSNPNAVISANQYLVSFLKSGDVPTMLWLRLYKRGLFFPPVFPKAYINNEDNFALPCILNNATNICFVDKPLHVYSTDNDHSFMNEIAIDTKKEKLKKVKISNLLIVKHVGDYLNISNNSPLKNEFDQFVFRTIISFLLLDIKMPYRERKRIINEYFCEYAPKNIELFLREKATMNCKTNFFIKIFGIRIVIALRGIIK